MQHYITVLQKLGPNNSFTHTFESFVAVTTVTATTLFLMRSQ